MIRLFKILSLFVLGIHSCHTWTTIETRAELCPQFPQLTNGLDEVQCGDEKVTVANIKQDSIY